MWFKRKPKHKLPNVLAFLYAEEQKIVLTSHWDSGWKVSLNGQETHIDGYVWDKNHKLVERNDDYTVMADWLITTWIAGKPERRAAWEKYFKENQYLTK